MTDAIYLLSMLPIPYGDTGNVRGLCVRAAVSVKD